MLPTLWFCLASVLLTGYVLLDGFDLGVGILMLFVARSEEERSHALRAIGPVWDGNEVWLLALGGALVLAFPTLYASAFSGFYLALMIVLWLLILRGVAMEFRHHIESAEWRQFWNVVFGLASTALALVFGIALGNVFAAFRSTPPDTSSSRCGPASCLPGRSARSIGIRSW
ncbi:MAG TPA: cytochrome d ubiquinol oxidase subunit II [Bryobacteraceae bacterium]|nr:cytochrome d ubiquinol oxidase subunit II [Bryobacteraceae bacterium]